MFRKATVIHVDIRRGSLLLMSCKMVLDETGKTDVTSSIHTEFEDNADQFAQMYLYAAHATTFTKKALSKIQAAIQTLDPGAQLVGQQRKEAGEWVDIDADDIPF